MESSAGREATCWYTFSTLDLDVRFGDRTPRRLGLYFLDYDDLKRSERIDVLNEGGQVLDSRVISEFRGGRYLIWDVVGPVRFRITPLSGPNAVVNGVFAGPVPGAAGGATGGAAAPAASGTNLAFRKPTTTSSRSSWSTPSESGGVDGVKDGRFGFHTAHEPAPWWEVDLQQVATIGEIRVFNYRENEVVAERARSLRALLSTDGLTWRQVHAQDRTFGTDGQPLRIMVGGVQARYVRLQLASPNYLHLDEVEVYGAGGGAASAGASRPIDALPGDTNPGPLGTTWDVVELGIRSVWTRRGQGNVFDVQWPGLRGSADVLLTGTTIVIDRRDETGLRCRYQGVLDGASMQGVFSCDNGATNVPWRATIRREP